MSAPDETLGRRVVTYDPWSEADAREQVPCARCRAYTDITDIYLWDGDTAICVECLQDHLDAIAAELRDLRDLRRKADGKYNAGLLALVHEWEHRARTKLVYATGEPDQTGRLGLEHAALCEWNCAAELRRAVGFDPETRLTAAEGASGV